MIAPPMFRTRSVRSSDIRHERATTTTRCVGIASPWLASVHTRCVDVNISGLKSIVIILGGVWRGRGVSETWQDFPRGADRWRGAHPRRAARSRPRAGAGGRTPRDCGARGATGGSHSPEGRAGDDPHKRRHASTRLLRVNAGCAETRPLSAAGAWVKAAPRRMARRARARGKARNVARVWEGEPPG